MIYTEEYSNYTDARKREIFLKSGVGREWIKDNFGDVKERWLSG